MTRARARRVGRVAVFAGLAALVRAGAACASAPVLSLTPPALMLGADRAATLDVRADDATPEALEVLASAGSVRDVTRVGPGHFVARYEPPESRAPDVAVLFVHVRGSADAASLSVPLAGRYRLSVSAEPGAEVAVRLGGEEQPRRAVAPASGTVQMVLHVPPGVDRATIEAVDRADNRTVRDEALELPPAHRVLIVPAPPDPSPGHAREVRWWLAAADPVGAPAQTPPAFRVEGGSARVERAAPGLFLLSARPHVRAEAGRIALRVIEPGLVSHPESVEVEVAASEPARMELGALGAVAAGEPVEVPLALTDAEGESVTGLAGRLSGSVGGREARLEEREGGGYALRGEAPARAGPSEVRVALAGSTLHAEVPLVVRPGAPARLTSAVTVLPREMDSEVELSVQDRHGNATVAERAVVGSEGAEVRRVSEHAGAVRVRLRPREARVRLWLQSGAARTDVLEIPVAREPPNRPVLAMGLSVRHNLHATMFYGTRLRMQYALPLSPRLWALGAVEAGNETALSGDAQGHQVVIEAVPWMARAGVLARFGERWVGLVVGGGARWVFARQRLPLGGASDATQWVPAASAAVLFRWRMPAGELSAELGAETGYLDTVAVRGTLGGVYGALAWGVGL